jgi:hypothetical protein
MSQMPTTYDDRSGDHLVAGEHRRGVRSRLKDCEGDVWFAAWFNTCAHGTKEKTTGEGGWKFHQPSTLAR